MNPVLRLLLPPFACVALWLALAAVPLAIERKALPAFTVTTANGSAVRSADLTQSGQWLFLYVSPSCAQCDALLRTIDQGDQPMVVSRLVIVVGGVDDAALATYAAAFSNLSSATWYADRSRSVPVRVKAGGIPFVLGMKEAITQWGLVGVVPDAESVASTLVSWAGPK